MARSFYEYVENRIVENFDYNRIAAIINEHVAEKGYITPEELQEAWFGIPAAARAVAGLAGGVGRMAGDLGGMAARGAGAAARGTAGALGKGAQFVGQSFKNVGTGLAQGAGQAAGALGSAARGVGQWAGGHMSAAKEAEAAKQVADRQKDLNANPNFQKLSPAEQAQFNAMLQKMQQAG